MLDEFMQDARSICGSRFSHFTKNKRLIITAIAAAGDVESILGKSFLARVPGLSKLGVAKIVGELLDRSVVATSGVDGRLIYRVADPLMHRYIRRYHCP